MNTSESTTLRRLLLAGLVIGVLALGVSVLMPSLSSSRKAAMMQKLDEDYGGADVPMTAAAGSSGERESRQVVPEAIVKVFDARIDLTPRLSVGTATPESIYEAKFQAKIDARAPQDAGGNPCRIEVPLPPQIISLADVNVTRNGEPDATLQVSYNSLIWVGDLDAEEDTKFEISYTAMGKGIFQLQKPPGHIVDKFRTELVAHGSNVRMLELSLQPQPPKDNGDSITYIWDYERLLVARPIALDVLGIAAIDKLGELTWLGPLSVLTFGVLAALAALALCPEKLSAWTVLLIVGCFTVAYPMMYFLQEFMPLSWAVALACGAIVAIIAVRSFAMYGLLRGLLAGVALPGAIMAISVAATIHTAPAVQGVLLTAMALLAFVAAMILVPLAQRNLRDQRAGQREDKPADPPPIPRASE